MLENKILCPAYFQIVKYDGKIWYFKHGQKFFNPLRISIPSFIDSSKTDKLAAFGTTKAKLAMEFRLINGGKIGYYLADLKDNNYHYCGKN